MVGLPYPRVPPRSWHLADGPETFNDERFRPVKGIGLWVLAITGAAFTLTLLVTGIVSGRFPIPGGDYLAVFEPVGDAVRDLRDPYHLTSDLGRTFFYAPPWAVVFAAITWLPTPAGHALVAASEVVALRYIVGSWRAAGIVGWCPLLAFELALGNVNLVVGALIVATVRGHWWAAIAASSAKLSPIIAVERGRIVPVVAIVLALSIPWGTGWIDVLSHAAVQGIGGHQVPVPIWLRCIAAAALILTGRPWARALGAVIALPAFYYQSLLLLVVPVGVWIVSRRQAAYPGA